MNGPATKLHIRTPAWRTPYRARHVTERIIRRYKYSSSLCVHSVIKISLKAIVVAVLCGALGGCRNRAWG